MRCAYEYPTVFLLSSNLHVFLRGSLSFACSSKKQGGNGWKCWRMEFFVNLHKWKSIIHSQIWCSLHLESSPANSKNFENNFIGKTYLILLSWYARYCYSTECALQMTLMMHILFFSHFLLRVWYVLPCSSGVPIRSELCRNRCGECLRKTICFPRRSRRIQNLECASPAAENQAASRHMSCAPNVAYYYVVNATKISIHNLTQTNKENTSVAIPTLSRVMKMNPRPRRRPALFTAAAAAETR